MILGLPRALSQVSPLCTVIDPQPAKLRSFLSTWHLLASPALFLILQAWKLIPLKIKTVKRNRLFLTGSLGPEQERNEDRNFGPAGYTGSYRAPYLSLSLGALMTVFPNCFSPLLGQGCLQEQFFLLEQQALWYRKAPWKQIKWLF